MIVLLRGVNVGGKNKLPMADLREIASACGYERVATYIQSGNMVLDPGGDDPNRVSETLRRAIAAETGIDTPVVVRTDEGFRTVLEASPFLATGADPSHLHVSFTDGDATGLVAGLDLDSFAPDEAVPVGADLHLHLPDGVGRSKLAIAIGRRKEPVGTARNWRTIKKLCEMLDAD